MGGVDLLDNHIANYRVGVRGKKWYSPIIMWLIDLSVTNSWSLAKHFRCRLDQLEFRRQLAEALLSKYGKPSQQGRTLRPSTFLTSGPHIITGLSSRLRCKQCKKQTFKKCETCSVPIHEKCFKIFHENLKT